MTVTDPTRRDDARRQLPQHTPSFTTLADLDESAMAQLRGVFELLDRWDRENAVDPDLEKDDNDQKS